MNTLHRLAIVAPNDETREQMKAALNEIELVWLEAECSRYESFCSVVKENRPDVCIVSLDSDFEKAVALIRELRLAAPHCQVLAVSSSSDGQRILQAIRAGAKEFLSLPIDVDELESALRLISNQGDDESERRRATTICVAGASGGAGATSIAVNVASILASDPSKSVVLVDLDLSLGDADVFLDAMPDYTLVDVAQNISRLDFDLLRRSLTKLNNGLCLLSRPVDLADIELVDEETVRRVLGLLRASFSHVVVDLSKSYSAVDMVALRSCDQALLVTQLDLPCLRNVVRLLQSLRHEEEIIDKLKVVVNRVGLENAPIRLKKAQEIIGTDIFWQIPNDYRLMVEVCNNGVPLIEQAPKAPVTQALIAMTRAVCGEEASPDAKPAPSEPASPKFSKLLNIWTASAPAR